MDTELKAHTIENSTSEVMATKEALKIGDTINYYDITTDETTEHIIETEAQLEQAIYDDCITVKEIVS